MTIVPVRTGASATAPISTLTVDEAALLQIPDPWERALQTAHLAEALHRLSGIVLGLRRQAVLELVETHREPKARVARHIGVTPTRISQMINRRASSSAEVGAVA